MRRAILVFLLAASICFQGVALAGQVIARDRSGDAAHAMLHAEAVPHHHHRGSIHKDQSKESRQHVENDCCTSVAGIPPSAIRAPQMPQPERESAEAQPRGHDSAFIEGLKRPPRTMA